MKKSITSDQIVLKIKDLLKGKSKDGIISLHEPDLSGTKSWEYVKDCIDSGWVSSAGEWVTRFEQQVCNFTGSKYSIAVTNGTVGLRLALHSCGVKSNEEVFVQSLSFVASANAISHLGAIPHFIDVNPENLGMNPSCLKERLDKVSLIRKGKIYNKYTGRRIAAILPVHIFGVPAKINEIQKISNEFGIPLVEDAAEALGSRACINNNLIHCGLIGDVGVISFNGNKIITTGGGGVVITNNKEIAESCKHLSKTAKISHPWDFDHDQIGWNDRLPGINAALGVAQIEDISRRLIAKKYLLNSYKELFKDHLDIEIISNNTDDISNNWLINLRFLDKDVKVANHRKLELLEISHKYSLLLRPIWKPLHRLEIYKDTPRSDLQVTEEQSQRIVSLPSSPQLIW